MENFQSASEEDGAAAQSWWGTRVHVGRGASNNGAGAKLTECINHGDTIIFLSGCLEEWIQARKEYANVDFLCIPALTAKKRRCLPKRDGE
mmetsp:Transcript_12228/g.18368  ORF Transcript_12228/g.18368 Transcript_12228/m.18368 type:complete len:91 (+) Transcript_12228:1145-1417(+)